MSVVEVVELRVPARLSYVPVLHELLATFCRGIAERRGADGLPDDWIWSLETAVNELVSNIVRHAYRDMSGDLRCVLTAHDEHVEAFFADSGIAHTPVPPSLPDPTSLQEGGYGMFLIHSLVDHVEYTRTPDGENHWRIAKQLPGSQDPGGVSVRASTTVSS